MFNSIFSDTSTGVNIGEVLIAAVAALALGVVIALVHKQTSRTSKNMLVTLATLPVLVMAVMIMINGSLGTSIAVLGAFSLIRFRSIAGNSKEILAVFFAMAIGLALGMGQVFFAVVITAIASLAEIAFSAAGFLEPNKNQKVLKVTIPEDMDYEEVFNEVFAKYTDGAKLMKMKTVNMGSLYKLTYEVKMKTGANEKQFLDEIRVKNCNLTVMLSHPLTEEDI